MSNTGCCGCLKVFVSRLVEEDLSRLVGALGIAAWFNLGVSNVSETTAVFGLESAFPNDLKG